MMSYTYNQKNTAWRTAMLDISKHNKEQDLPKNREHGDTWYITCDRVFTKEQRKLNRLLGLHKINKADSIYNIKRNNKNK